MIERTEILLALQDSLIGEIYNNIRMIVFEYDEKLNIFTLYYYLDREPRDEDHESISNVMGEFLAHFNYSQFESINEVCLHENQPVSELNIYNGIVYARKENRCFINNNIGE